MLNQGTYKHNTTGLAIAAKMSDYAQLVKVRLTLMVVFSTFAGYFIAAPLPLNPVKLVMLLFGGFLVTGAANGINQIIEKDSDALMSRTSNRPLAQQRITVLEAFIFCTVLGTAGIVMLGTFLNPLSAMLALGSLILYAFVYTPLKKITPISVFVGAFPGAFPPMIGYVAFTGKFDFIAGLLFLIQFVWQFPHFWAIAWVLADDYKKAGYYLLPMGRNKDKTGALQIMMFTILLFPVVALMMQVNFVSWISVLLSFGLTFYFFWYSWKLYRKLDNASAKKLMFCSFFYLPIVQILFMIEKVL